MKQAPLLLGGTAARVICLFVGLFLFAVAIVCLLASGLGLSPWDVFQQGLAKHTPLTLGTASIVVGLIVMVVAWALGQPPGFGTVANAVVIGLCIDLLLQVDALAELRPEAMVSRILLLAAALALFGLGSAMYIGAGFGAGPRDSLMLVGSRRLGIRIAIVRFAMEVIVVTIGWALGGVVGVGTLVFVLAIGPVVEGSFWLFVRLGFARMPAGGLEEIADEAY